MLLSTEVNLISKKKSHKQNLIRLGDSNGNKVIFVLLAKVVALHVEPSTIDVKGFGLEKLISSNLL